MKYSLRWKLLGSFMLIITLLLGSVLFGVSLIVKDHARLSRQEELQAKGVELAKTLKQLYIEKGNFSDLDNILDDADSYLGARVWLVDTNNQLVSISQAGTEQGFGRGRMNMGKQGNQGNNAQGGMGNMHGMMHGQMRANMRGAASGNNNPQSCMNDLNDLVNKTSEHGQSCAELYNNPYYNQQMLLVTVPITLDNGQKLGTLLLQEPSSSIDVYMRNVYYYLAGTWLLAILVALILVYWLTKRIVHPLTAMEQTATEMATGNYDQHLPIESQDEVGRLSKALNSLAVDLSNYMKNINQQEKLRRDFVANVSHELRTPLTIIKGYGEALLTGAAENPEERHEYCQLMQEEISRLERLIADLLDLSRLQGAESGKAALEKEKLPLADLADGLVHKLQQTAEKKNITLTVDKKTPSPLIWGNGDRIMQLLLIFVDNALKYTSGGGKVTITTSTEEDHAVVTIADTGKGIAQEDLPYVWERFYKGDKSHSRSSQGTGLGLAIAKEILALHHGQAKMSSTVGQGTTVKLIFDNCSQDK
jgi:signal transduction histidine kinase